MKKAKYDWQIPINENLPEEFIAAVSEQGLAPVFAQLLWNRGIQTSETIQTFLNPSMEQLHDPYLFYDMENVVERIHQAIVEDENILIYGDYDADGITSTTVLKEALEILGAQVETYLPNRFEDGYGPNKARYKAFIDAGVQLIITVDNGVSGHEAIDFANECGVDVIVTDHHELPLELPNAYGIIHPRHPEGSYPFKDLAGVGVSFKLACALLDEIPMELLDLVAIGTVADMVSLTDENRILVTWGLKQLKQGTRLGLNQLLMVSGIKLSDVDETTIGFSIAPRLNAVGRLGDANPAVELMTTFDEEKAASLAQAFNQINQQRKELVEETTKKALDQVRSENHVHLVVGEDWHEGILGIVAGRIMQETGKPTIVLTKKQEDLYKGSGRSFQKLNLFSVLQENQSLLHTFGGHHSAVGVSVMKEQLAQLQNNLNQYVETHQIDFSQGLPLSVEGKLPFSAITLPFIQSLKILAPFGMDNPVPQFIIEEVDIVESRIIGSNQQHLKFVVGDATGASIEGVGFGFGGEQSEFQHANLRLATELTINEWNGKKLPQLRLLDYEVPDFQVFDFRGKRQQQSFSSSESIIHFAFSQKLFKSFKTTTNQPVIYVDSFEHFSASFSTQWLGKTIAFIDAPSQIQLVKEIVNYTKTTRVYLLGQTADEAYLDGIGSREQYATLFRLLKQQPSLDVRHKLMDISRYTKIPKNLLIFMIQVFSELEFVTITDGVLKVNQTPKQRSLEESQLYQNRLMKIKSEEFLLLSDISKIKQWFAANEEK